MIRTGIDIRRNQGAGHGKRGHANVKEAFRPGPLE
jgi:hypothetical protein